MNKVLNIPCMMIEIRTNEIHTPDPLVIIHKIKSCNKTLRYQLINIIIFFFILKSIPLVLIPYKIKIYLFEFKKNNHYFHGKV